MSGGNPEQNISFLLTTAMTILSSAVLLILLGTGFAHASLLESQVRDLPPPLEIVRMDLFAENIKKNDQGHWEAALGKGIVMVYIPPGDFAMGSPPGESGREPNEGPVHTVFIKGFWIGKFEVAQEIWHAVMGGDAPSPEMRALAMGDVSHRDIQRFLLALNKETGLGFRLPTEAEWERCCRSGSRGSRYGPLDQIAWHEGNSGGRVHPVGTKKPNGFGLHDMIGNVWEWCSDWYDKNYYKISSRRDPAGPRRGKRRVVRGGGFLHGGHYLRFAHRNSQKSAVAKPYLGFRLALDISPSAGVSF